MKNTVKLNEAQLRQIVAESVKKVLRETSLDYDEDNFSGRNYRPAHYDIYIGDYIEYHGVPEDAVDRLYYEAQRKAEMWGDEVRIQEV